MLRYKLFRWFAVIILIFGVASAYFGIRMIGRRVVNEAQDRVRSNLNSAWAQYQSRMDNLATVIRLNAARSPLIDALDQQDNPNVDSIEELKGILAATQLDFDLDFLTMTGPEGQVVVRATPTGKTGDYRTGDPLVARALSGEPAMGTVLLSPEELQREAEELAERAFIELQDTPHSRVTPRSNEDRGMCMVATAPIEKNGRVLGALYGGILLNRNMALVDGIENIVFQAESYHGVPLGSVTVFLADTRIATTVLLENDNRALGTRVSREVAERVLDNGRSWVRPAFVVRDWYLTAYDPIKDPQGQIIGMLYVGILQRPFSDLSLQMILRYSSLVAVALIAAVLLALFMADRLSRPLHRLAEMSTRMERGDGFVAVPSCRSCAETDNLIRSFNRMAATLSQREKELTEAVEQVNQANTSLTALNHDYMETVEFVSHELQSPVSTILNYNYMLRQKLLGDVNEKQEKALTTMESNLRRLTEMIRHYLNLARIENGEMQLVPAQVPLVNEVIAPMLAAYENDIRHHSMRVENNISSETTVFADLNMTREIFENLLSNAIKYGRDGGLITIDAHTENGRLYCSVRNEGEGIPPDKVDSLFLKFSRLGYASGEPDKHKGTGLGLFITRKIVEAHGGTIEAASKLGEWVEFKFDLPAEWTQSQREQSNT